MWYDVRVVPGTDSVIHVDMSRFELIKMVLLALAISAVITAVGVAILYFTLGVAYPPARESWGLSRRRRFIGSGFAL